MVAFQGEHTGEWSKSPWVWSGNELFDAHGNSLATVSSDVLYFGDERLLVESDLGPIHFRARATTGDGRVFTLSQSGFTVNQLDAKCDGRAYTLRRRSMWRKERMITDSSGAIALIRPLISGKVQVLPEPTTIEVPMVDALFLSWCCVLVDSPVRRPRI